MRSALLCVFFAFIIPKEGSRATSDNDFRPTPIPLNDWQHSKRDGRAGTLHEIIKTDAPLSVAAVPAHYWEDALRHSVYLTLVRDKIDQLITKGAFVSPVSETDQHASKEVNDHDLWEKIKSAPFDRLKDKEPASFGDVTIMAKGRLLEDNKGYRFSEDEESKEKCSGEKCSEGVKAYWSVKRVRQRDVEASAGKYHYELTFSVNSQAPKKQRKSHENPARTFTVRENMPVEQHQAYRIHEPIGHTQRPQRAIWFHKNIAPIPHQGRKHHQGLDRIFSSLFSNEESYEESPPRYKQNPYVPQVLPQHSKVGYVGASTEQHQQKKLTPYPYKPNAYKYLPQPLPAPPLPHSQHQYLDQDYHDVMVNSPYAPPHTDYRYLPSNIVKTTRPAVLPTPLGAFSQMNVSMEVTNRNRYNTTDVSSVTKDPDIVTGYKMYARPKPTSIKVSYFTDHVRPPVYNAPPGVFVTMDKKPFKPMPPLKLLHSPKTVKNKPIDFRPSPQVLDVQFSDPDSLSEAFRPITMNYVDSNTTDKSEETESSKKGSNTIRKSKPPKKHEIVKSQRITTTAPDIITAHSDSDEENDTMEWANLLGAFTKTTPMASQKEKVAVTESIAPKTTTTTTTTVRTRPSTTETEEITTTTQKPKKRTRPPPKFTKPEKIKKHKRVTTTTTTTTKAPEKAKVKRPVLDLTPQASSAATSSTKSGWHPKSKVNNVTFSTTPLSTTAKTTTSTSRPSTSTTQSTTTSTTTAAYEPTLTTYQRSKNRFRQSTLMQKGTSVNHDKWSVALSPEKNRTLGPLSSKYPPRRKGSNFQGYVPSSTPRNTDAERNKEDHEDLVDHLYTNKINRTTESTTESKPDSTSPSTQPTYEDSVDQYEANSESPSEYSQESDEGEESDEQESKDDSEYIFHLTSSSPSEKTNEISDTEQPSTTEDTIRTSPHTIVKNKTKCKKKKHNNLTPEGAQKDSSDAAKELTTKISTTTTTTENTITPDILSDLFDGFTMDDSIETTKSKSPTKSEPEEGESEKHEQYVHVDDDFEDFLDSLEGKGNHNNENSEEEYEDEDRDEEEDSPFNNEEENEFGRQAQDDSYDDYQDRPRPYSFLELMAME